jgi:hypothetical protein
VEHTDDPLMQIVRTHQHNTTRTDSIKDLGVFIDSELHFHNHVDYIFCQCIKLLGLVRAITFPFSSLGSLCMLYCTLIRSKLEYASVVWNSLTTTDANKLERIQRKFAALCYNRFLPQVHYTYSNALERLKLHTLRKRRNHLDALFLIQDCLGSKFSPSVLETVGLRVPTRHLRDFPLFYVCPTIKNCPSARCATAANVVCRDFDVFRNHNVSLENILL